MKKRIIIFGGGGHSKVVIELLRILGTWDIAGLIDDHLPVGTQVLDVPILGTSELLNTLRKEGINHAVNTLGGINNYQIRLHAFEKLESLHFQFPNLIHPSAVLEPSVKLDSGIQILAKTYISSDVEIDFGTLINAGVIVSHDCVIGRCVNLSPGAMLGGEVHIGNYAQVGMGATINMQVKIGKEARVGNGATVKGDVPPRGRVFAGTIWPYRENLSPDSKTFRKIA
jgi:sugar O-acyltransferase (sialic acid O-acetyltransferase NeuD family)